MKKKKKKSRKKLLIIPIILLGSLYAYNSDLINLDLINKQVTEGKTESYIQDYGNITVYFCPREDCEGALVSFLDSAEKSIHCAFFEVDLDQVRDKLLEKSKEIEVHVVTDNNYLYEFNHSFVKTDTWGLMHNKFCIIDGKKVSTGSMNPTTNGAHKNNNNLLLINSPVLASNYETEFQELWNGTFKKGNTILNPSIMLGNISIQNYFCPEDHCADKIKQELKKAKSSIYFMTFSFTHQGIADILLLNKMDNLTIKGVMEARQVTKYSVFKQLQYQDLDLIKDGNPQNMHHKVFIIDHSTVITGSFNPTDGGDKNNDENVLIIKDEKIAQLFLEEFEKVREEATKKLES